MEQNPRVGLITSLIIVWPPPQFASGQTVIPRFGEVGRAEHYKIEKRPSPNPGITLLFEIK